MKAKAPVSSIRSSSAYERFIYTLRPECLESATPTQLGGTTVDRVFFYDEIQEVYRYREIDWASLGRIFLVLLIFGGIGLGIWAGGPSPITAIVVWILGVVWIGFESYRGFVVKKPMVRVVGNKQSAIFTCRSESFFEELIVRLRTANPAAAPPVVTPPMAQDPINPPPPVVAIPAPIESPTVPPPPPPLEGTGTG
jgi:hypothetical protein